MHTDSVRNGPNAIEWVAWMGPALRASDLTADSHPVSFCDCQRIHAVRAARAHATLGRLCRDLERVAATAALCPEVHGRVKGVFSTWLKMRAKQRRFDEIDDYLGVRVLVDGVNDCYAVLRAVGTRWCGAGNISDYIRHPKANGYRSLHVTLVDDRTGWPFEVQIRTRSMHLITEHGGSSHWSYKLDQLLLAGGE